MEIKRIWELVCELISKELQGTTFDEIFVNVIPVELKKKKLVMKVESKDHEAVLSEKYKNLIVDAVKIVSGEEVDIDFIIGFSADEKIKLQLEKVFPFNPNFKNKGDTNLEMLKMLERLYAEFIQFKYETMSEIKEIKEKIEELNINNKDYKCAKF